MAYGSASVFNTWDELAEGKLAQERALAHSQAMTLVAEDREQLWQHPVHPPISQPAFRPNAKWIRSRMLTIHARKASGTSSSAGSGTRPVPKPKAGTKVGFQLLNPQMEVVDTQGVVKQLHVGEKQFLSDVAKGHLVPRHREQSEPSAKRRAIFGITEITLPANARSMNIDEATAITVLEEHAAAATPELVAAVFAESPRQQTQVLSTSSSSRALAPAPKARPPPRSSSAQPATSSTSASSGDLKPKSKASAQKKAAATDDEVAEADEKLFDYLARSRWDQRGRTGRAEPPTLIWPAKADKGAIFLGGSHFVSMQRDS